MGHVALSRARQNILACLFYVSFAGLGLGTAGNFY